MSKSLDPIRVKHPALVDCWFFTGKESSFHFVLKEQIVELGNGLSIKVPERQINIDLPAISKYRVRRSK